MTDSTALNAFTGGVGHLRLHAPIAMCPFQMSARRDFKNFNALNTAFQLATGWELAYRETDASYRHRSRVGQTGIMAIGKLTIADLSPLLPPGIPAVSRIYCEKLVVEFNKVLAELAHCRQQLVATEAIADSAGNPEMTDSAARSGETKPPLALETLKSNVPFQTSNISLTPLSVDQDCATCEWFIEESGQTRFAAMVCQNGESNSTRELIAARSTFLAECRHGSTNQRTHDSVQHVVARMFPGNSSIAVLAGTVNPLTGEVTIFGSDSFQLTSTNPGCKNIWATHGESKVHVQPGRHLMISRWPARLETSETGDIASWVKETLGKLNGLVAVQLTEAFRQSIVEAIPSLPAAPQIALAISRP